MTVYSHILPFPSLSRCLVPYCLLCLLGVLGSKAASRGAMTGFNQLSYPPNDPLFPRQVKLFEALHIKETWKAITQSALLRRDVIVTVIDTGVATKHPELKGKLLNGSDASGSWRSSTAEDRNGHGTVVASIIAAGINNGFGMAGIADKVKIRPIRITTSRKDGIKVSQIKKAWEIATKFDDSDIIVFAIGGEFTPEKLSMYKRLIGKAVGQGQFVIVAGTNSNSSTGFDELELPCSLANTMPGVVCVTAQKP